MRRSLLALFSIFVLSTNSILPVSAYYTNMSASVVIGQPDFTSTSANQGGSPNANTFNIPQNVAICGGKLVVSDSTNHRVLIYNRVPEVNNASADVVVGQQNFSSGSADQGASVGPNTLDNPNGVVCVGSKLIIGDAGNNRILIYNQVPTSNNASADVVIGQTNFTSSSANQGGTCGANTLSGSGALMVTTDGTKLFVADRSNSRVLIFNSVPTTNNASADVVVGQLNFTTCVGMVSANRFHLPRFAFSDGQKLYVSEQTADRVLIFNSVPTTNGASADVVVGQPDFTSEAANQGGSVGANTLSSPKGVDVVNGRLVISDQNNHRTLIWNKIPTSNNSPADIVIGQPNFTSNSANQGGTAGANTFSSTQFHLSYRDKLFVPDFSNNRLLIFNNVLSSPHLSVSKVEQLSGDSGKLKITGSTEIGERGRYSLSSVVASVNGLGYGNVTSKDNGRDNGDGKTLYEFTHEFEPWVNNNGDKNTWKDRGYTVALKAISSNAEEDEVLLFSPFTLKAMNKNSSSLEFSVPSIHWSTLTDKLSGYRIGVKRKTDKEWSTLTTISPSHSNNTTVSGSTTNPTYTSTLPSSSLTPLSKSLKINTVVSSYTPSTGEIKVKVDTSLPSGEYRIQAVSKTGSTFSSNTISHTSSSTVSYLPSLTLTTSWFPLQINKITGTNLSILSSFSTYTPKPLTSSTTTPTVSGIAPSYSTVYLQVTNSSTPTQKKLYKTTTTSNTSFSIPISLYPKSTLDTWVTNQHNTTVLSPISLTTNSNLKILDEYIPKKVNNSLKTTLY